MTNLIILEEERLPFREGWRTPTAQINGFIMADAVLQEALATPEKSVYFNEAPPSNTDTTYDIPTCEKKSSVRRRSRTLSR